MRSLYRILLLLACCAGLLQAQSAEQIIDRHVKVVGGAKALRAVQSVRMEGTARVGNEERPFLWQAKKPNLFYLEFQGPSGAIIEACNGRAAWREDPAKGARTLSGPEQSRGRATAFFRNDRFLTFKKENTKVLLTGRANVEGRPAYVVEITSSTGGQRRLYFDAENYLLVKEEQDRDDGREEMIYGDYRAVDGVKEPHRIEWRRGGETLVASVQRVVHNAGVDDRVFDFPARQTRPLPDLAALLDAVEKNQEQVEKVRENYTFTQASTEINIDGKGRVQQKSERVYEVFFVHGRQIAKLVKKDGQPLSEPERRKEDERVTKLIEKFEKQYAEAEERKQKEAKRAAESDQKKSAKKDKNDDFTLSDFLRVSKITNPRRERFSGKDVVIFEFAPNPNFKAKTRAESIVQKLSGMFWVDEEAKQIARLEARTLETIRFGGVVAKLSRGAEFTFEQEMVNNEVWLPRYAEAHFDARVLLVKGFHVHRITRFSDYKKFSITTRSEIKPPKQEPPQ